MPSVGVSSTTPTDRAARMAVLVVSVPVSVDMIPRSATGYCVSTWAPWRVGSRSPGSAAAQRSPPTGCLNPSRVIQGGLSLCKADRDSRGLYAFANLLADRH